MIPEGSLLPDIELNQNPQPSKTYKIDTENNRITTRIDGLEAVKQAVYLILGTERYDYLIYSHNYGTEFRHLEGKDFLYVKAEIKRVIQEALLQDDRIIKVDNFKISQQEDKDSLLAEFDVTTKDGMINISKEVGI